MLTLYYKPTCPYSQTVLNEAENLHISCTLKDITDDVLRAELNEVGGKVQTPFLVDTDTGVSLYESRDIIDYLYERYGSETAAPTFTGVRVHDSSEVCDSCQ